MGGERDGCMSCCGCVVAVHDSPYECSLVPGTSSGSDRGLSHWCTARCAYSSCVPIPCNILTHLRLCCRYVMQWDDDSYITGPLPYNLVQKMDAGNYSLAVRRIATEPPLVVWGLAELTKYFIQAHAGGCWALG